MSTISPEKLRYYQEHADDNLQPNIIATIVICLVLPCIAVCLRFVSRWQARAGYKYDDWLILCALAPLAGMTTTTGFTVRFGQGRHIIFVKDPVGHAKAYVAGIVVYTFTVVFTKLSILFLYHRVFPSRGMKIQAYIIGSLVLAYSAALIIFDFLQCIPLSFLWNQSQRGTCVSTTGAFVTLAVMNVVTDIMILILPIRYVLRLQMSASKKLQVLSAFALGGIVCVFGIVRAYYVGLASTTDPTWTAAYGAMWSQVEIGVGIISACLPVYRPLFMRRRPSKHSGYINSEYSSKMHDRSDHILLSETIVSTRS